MPVSPSGLVPAGDLPSLSNGPERVASKAGNKIHGAPRKRNRRGGSNSGSSPSSGASARQLGSSKAARFQAKIEARKAAASSASADMASAARVSPSPLATATAEEAVDNSELPLPTRVNTAAPPAGVAASSYAALQPQWPPHAPAPPAPGVLPSYMPQGAPGGHLVWVHVPGQGILPALVPQLPMFPPPGLAMLPMGAMPQQPPHPGPWYPAPPHPGMPMAPSPAPPHVPSYHMRPSPPSQAAARPPPVASRAVNVCKKCHKPYMNPHHVRDRRNKWICMEVTPLSEPHS